MTKVSATKVSPVGVTVLLICGFAAGPVLADSVGAGWISLEQATQKAKDAGYTELSKIAADDGRWEGQGVKDGKLLEFHMDPKTGAISNEHPDN